MLYLILLLILILVFIYWRKQMHTQRLCRQMLEALANKDYSFRLSEKGTFFGDKSLIRTLNGLIQKIGEEQQNAEVQSWEKLTRILTHEIMNGIAPITSLSDIFLKRKDVQQSSIYDGIKAIHDTSNGLMEFVDSYRKFTTLQAPTPEVFSITEMLEGVKNLGMVPEGINLNMSYDMKCDLVKADRNLLRQVIINIIKNAVESFSPYSESKGNAIQVFAYQYEGTPLRIRIANNGTPIPEEVRQDIFIPFFSTKKTGSGIGLALCRQIMRLSGGSINLLRNGANGWTTSFVLELPVHQKG